MFVELENATEPSNEDKMTILMCKIKLLGQEYIGSPHCFPIGNCISYMFDFILIILMISFMIFIPQILSFSYFRFSSKTIGNEGM